MTFSHLFEENNIIEEIKATEKKAAIEEMIDIAVERGICPKSRKKSAFEAVLEREKLGSTGLGHGVAIPHVKIDGLQGQVSILTRSKEGIDFSAIDGEPVHVLFFLISATKNADEHLRILQWISRMARHQDFVKFIRNAKDTKEILGIVKEFGE